ncbi:MAG: hypothetical protein ABIJ37_10935 [Pseudomonadota bacterium]
MEKTEIIKKVCRSKEFRDLTDNELKLYMLLLLFSNGLNKKEQVDLEVIRRVSGDIFTLEELEKIGVSLKEKNLASLTYYYPKEAEDSLQSDKGDQYVKLYYELYDFPYKYK